MGVTDQQSSAADPRPEWMRGRVRSWVFVLSLIPVAAVSGWIGIWLCGAGLLRPHHADYVVYFFAVTGGCFSVLATLVYYLLGLRYVRFPNGKILLVDVSPFLRLRRMRRHG